MPGLKPWPTSHWQSQITHGVLPVPPTLTLPIMTTGTGSRVTLSKFLRYRTRRSAEIRPKIRLNGHSSRWSQEMRYQYCSSQRIVPWEGQQLKQRDPTVERRANTVYLRQIGSAAITSSRLA